MKTQENIMDFRTLSHDGHSRREIAKRMGVDPRTVKKYLEHPELAGQPRKTQPRKNKLDPYRQQIEQLLEAEPAYTATVIHNKIKKAGFNGGYEIVKRAVRPLKQKMQRKAYVRYETEPAAQAQMDFGEFQVNQPDGTCKTYYLFSIILGYSRAIYAELLEKCDLPAFLEAHQRAFAALGGVPLEILYDRMKNVLVQVVDGQPKFTQSLVNLAIHYGFKPIVAPAYSPWVKGKVERPFHYLRESFWRGYEFTHLERANQDLKEWITEDRKRTHATTHEKIDVRLERERPHLLRLPPHPCDVSERLFRQVRKDCAVSVLGNRYLVPHTLVGENVTVRLKGREVRIFADDKLVATYETPADGKKAETLGDKSIYEELLKDREMQAKKYAHPSKKTKGRAKSTVSPTKPAHEIDVQTRPLSEYAKYGGEVAYA